MQRDPEQFSIPLETEGEAGLPQMPLRSIQRETWVDALDEENIATVPTPYVGQGFAAPEELGALAALAAAATPGISRGQQIRRRAATGCISACIGLLLVLLSITAIIYLRPVVDQPGSGEANGVDIHPTPVAPLAQLQTAVPTPSPTPGSAPGSSGQTDKHPDPQVTPTPRPNHNPTTVPGPPQPTATPVIMPTVVPTSGPTPVGTQQPTPTTAPQPRTPTPLPPTPTSPPQPTATTAPSSGSLTFTDQSQRFSGPADLVGCPSGCSFVTQPVNGSVHEATTRTTTGWHPQTQLSGSVTVTYSCDPLKGNCQNAAGYFVSDVSGGGYDCPVNQEMTVTTIITVGCSFSVSSPSYLAPNTISGQYSGPGGPGTVLAWSSSAFYGNGYSYVSQSDCTNALTSVENQGWSWVASTWASLANGNIVATGYSDSENNWSCFPGVGAAASSFTASVDAHINNGLVYSPSGPTNAAFAALKAAAPGGWNCVYTSTACYPQTVGVSGTTVTAACQDAGLATYPWSASDMAGLAQAVAGQSLSSAQSICNGYAHVAGNCVASSDASNVMPAPSDWQAISINPQSPPNPFGAAALGTSGGSFLVAAGLERLLTLFSVVLLCTGCSGVLRYRRRQRKAGS